MQQQRGAGDRFALAVTRQSVAQTALAVGCKYTYTSVLDALTDLVRDYIICLGLEAQAKAEAGGRSIASVLDFLAALEERQQNGRDRYELDWRSLRSFAFGDQTATSHLDRPDVPLWYQPFHTHIPPFPIPSKRPRLLGPPLPPPPPAPATVLAADGSVLALPPPIPSHTAAAAGGGGGGGAGQQQPQQQPPPRLLKPRYVPSFLPPFPAEHTFKKTGVKATGKTEDPAAIQKHRIATKQLIYKAIEKASVKEDKGRVSSSTSSSSLTRRKGKASGEKEEEEEDYDDLFSSEAQPFGEGPGEEELQRQDSRGEQVEGLIPILLAEDAVEAPAAAGGGGEAAAVVSTADEGEAVDIEIDLG